MINFVKKNACKEICEISSSLLTIAQILSDSEKKKKRNSDESEFKLKI